MCKIQYKDDVEKYNNVQSITNTEPVQYTVAIGSFIDEAWTKIIGYIAAGNDGVDLRKESGKNSLDFAKIHS